MLEHTRERSLRLQYDMACNPSKQWHITDELQCVAEPIAAADQHAFSIERFSAPGGFLVIPAASKTIAVLQRAITNAPGCFEITTAHVLPPPICQSIGHP